MKYSINKGVGKSVEFNGLTSQYIYLLAGGLLGLFLLFVILSIVGVPTTITLSLVGVLAPLFIWQLFRLSERYGEHGVMKRQARSYHPRYIIRRESIRKLLKQQSNAKHI